MQLEDISSFIKRIQYRAPRGTPNDECRRVMYEELDKLKMSDCWILMRYFQTQNTMVATVVMEYYIMRENRPREHSQTQEYSSLEHLMFDSGWNGKILEKESQSTP